MSQAQAFKSAKQQTASQRIIFSDSNRALHLQAFFEWLPENLRDTPLIDWTQIPSKLIGYLMNTVGDSPFAASLAIAAGAGAGAMKAYGLRHDMTRIYRLLCGVQTLCNAQSLDDLTSSTWETYVVRKNLTPGDFSYFKTYAAFTERYLPDYLEQLKPSQYARLEPYVLPRLPRKFRERHLPSAAHTAGEKQRRKGKSDVIVPLHSTLVALVRFRKQSAQRLLSAYHEARECAKTASVELPLPFSYEEELVTVNRDAKTVADIRLEKQPVTMRFLLWDRRSWMKMHKDDYGYSIQRYADLGTEELAEPPFFVQCLNPVEELLWFGNLIKYRLFQQGIPQNITPEDSQQRRQLLSQLGTVQGLTCTRDGILMPETYLTIFLSKAIARSGALLFDAEALCRGALFASALVTMALTNGSRTCELLQVSADRFKVRPYVVQKDRNSAREERVIHLQLLLPKGRSTEAERKLFPISDWSWENCSVKSHRNSEVQTITISRLFILIPKTRRSKASLPSAISSSGMPVLMENQEHLLLMM